MEIPQSLEFVLVSILNDPEHHLHQAAKKFRQYSEELWQAPAGREFLYFVCGLAHPYRHAPCNDPLIAAHLSGRAEVTALLLRSASPEQTPLVPTTQTNTPQWADPQKKKANVVKRRP